MRKIVVPTDFSPVASNALLLAVRMFKYERSDFYILHSSQNANASGKKSPSSTGVAVEKNVDSEDRLTRLIASIEKASANPHHKFIPKLVTGRLIDEIDDICETNEIDVVIMGTKGWSKKKDRTLGSNTLAVIKFIKAPVICVPSNFKFEKLDTVLFPSNYLVPYTPRELKLLGELARRFVSKIHFLYVSDFPPTSKRQKENMEDLVTFFKANFISFDNHNHAPVHKVIEHTIRELEADLLVLVNSQHSYLSQVITSSSVENFTLFGSIPLLVLQNLDR